MRVLVLHGRYASGSLSGENRVVDDEVELLRAGGHDVHVLAPLATEFSHARLAVRSLTSAGIGEEVAHKVRAGGVRVVHCHNLYPSFGAGVLKAAADAGAAVVLTLHNYRLMCPAGTLFRDGRICQDCVGRVPLPAIVHACYRQSRIQSATISVSLATAKALGRFDAVDRFLAVSGFVKDKHIEAGLSPDRIGVKPNFVAPGIRRLGAGRYFLILSRLSPEKGIAEIVRVWKPEIGELLIVGDGPERASIDRLADGRGVKVLGAMNPSDVAHVLAEARALLLPSSWFEGLPRVAVEAYAAGVPVIASRIGSLSDVVEEGRTGYTVDPGDTEAWLRGAARLADDECSARLGDAAYELWESRFSPSRALEALEESYSLALERRARRRSTAAPTN